jgi:hypothetical protein
MVAVSDLVRSCLTKFTSLVSSAALSDHAEEVSLQSWKDEIGRLRVWSVNIGAHQRGQSSLDFRLRDASHIRSQTINLLQGLEDLLNDLKEVLEEDSDDEAPENVENPSDDNTTEIQQLHKDIVETIHHLYRMSMIIRTPAHHDRLLGTNKLDAQPFKHWAHNHASNKYPLADPGVLECVSSAMALQRAILKYRERHHAKLSQNLDDGNGTLAMNLEKPRNQNLGSDIQTVHGSHTLSHTSMAMALKRATMMYLSCPRMAGQAMINLS